MYYGNFVRIQVRVGVHGDLGNLLRYARSHVMSRDCHVNHATLHKKESCHGQARLDSNLSRIATATI